MHALLSGLYGLCFCNTVTALVVDITGVTVDMLKVKRMMTVLYYGVERLDQIQVLLRVGRMVTRDHVGAVGADSDVTGLVQLGDRFDHGCKLHAVVGRRAVMSLKDKLFLGMNKDRGPAAGRTSRISQAGAVCIDRNIDAVHSFPFPPKMAVEAGSDSQG